MGRDDRRIAALRRFAEHVAGVAPIDLSVGLWDGTVLPLSPKADGRLVLAIRTPAALTRLVRRPRLPTVVELIAEGAVDLEGGTLLDLAAAAGSGSTRGIAKRLNKGLALRAFLPFLFGPGGGGQGHAYAGVQAAKHGQGRDDKAQVQFHYDVSNAFYSLFLDPEMVYSCAYYPDWDADLATAQKAKLDMSCRKLRLKPGERMLDIGCGWGGLVCHAAQHFGVQAHGVTLSQAQFDFATEKVKRLGLQDHVTIELRDFRELTGEFDKIASIGMFEHVGLDNRDGYFRHIRSLLKPRGIYLHHAIARPMKATEKKFRKANPEFRTLVNYIFPGGELDHIGGTTDAMERNGFEIHDTEGWREHYGRTCRLWTERLYANREAAYAEAGEARTKIWLMYLAGCALAFERGTVGIFQTVATKRARGASGLPPTRGDLYA
ncbi:cyclopropane-fatty-acyl-phospholipid synthase family protein [Roseomonas sp. HJA6]|uniref:Cyclopropane-fatty-acyl-phospholipid synthase family protein n=1 Tax=Roseomonas alba TaxID=2846776 RepID=A0ABS7A9N0_9PROT|nr:cyclopropane-fatty-acyl-phospholipid synthase family protein [Neoroseomonas alba]MBW6399016.1 cyclopropane-fatty-acyl-phospholipid synthase family protein [Neoroseomonas alba]